MALGLGGGKRSRDTNDSADSFGKKTESMRKAKEYESGCFSMLSTYQPFYERLTTAGLATNEDKFIRCTVELSRYLAIKAMRNDIIATPQIQQVLHELLLFPQFYYNVCKKLLPGNDRGVIDNNPLLTNTPGQYQFIIDLYKSYFGHPDPEYWPTASSSDVLESTNKTRSGSKLTQGSNNNLQVGDNTEKFQISIKKLTGQIVLISCFPTDLVLHVKSLLQTKEGTPVDDQRFIYAGRQLEDHRSISDYNILNGSTIHLVLKLKGC